MRQVIPRQLLRMRTGELGVDGGQRQMRMVRVVSGWCRNGVGVMLNGLSLFSGIGGLDVALFGYVRPIAYCEIDAFCQGILLSRMYTNDISRSPIFDDVNKLRGGKLPDIDIIYGGFPCQDISVAGHGKGLAGERSGLYWQIHRLAKEILPKFIFLENVPAICTKGGWEVVSSLAEVGYDSRWCVISAASVGALHRRERWFLLAHANQPSSGREFRELPTTNATIGQPEEYRKENASEYSNGRSDVADTRCPCERMSEEDRRDFHDDPEWTSFHDPRCCRFWEVEPNVGRVADGVQFRVDRIKCLGNAVVPIQAKTAFETLMGLK